MRHMFIFASLSIWFLSAIKPQYGAFVYLMWLAAFTLMLLGWSLIFSIISLITTTSYFYHDLSSPSIFYSTILPWSAGISALILFFSLIFKYKQILGGNSRIDPTDGVSSGYSDGGSSD